MLMNLMKLSFFDMNEVIAIISILAIYLIFGYMLSLLAKEELKQGKKWFKILVILGIASGVIFLVLEEIVIGVSCFGMALTAWISLLRT